MWWSSGHWSVSLPGVASIDRPLPLLIESLFVGKTGKMNLFFLGKVDVVELAPFMSNCGGYLTVKLAVPLPFFLLPLACKLYTVVSVLYITVQYKWTR